MSIIHHIALVHHEHTYTHINPFRPYREYPVSIYVYVYIYRSCIDNKTSDHRGLILAEYNSTLTDHLTVYTNMIERIEQ